jgi:hypothetical protein
MSNTWSQSGLNQVEYREDLKQIDRSIAKLLAQREQVTEGK